MGFVKSPEELARLISAFRRPSFEDARALSAEFLTDPAAVRRLLPPSLEPVDEPLASARVGSFRSNIFGAYQSAGLHVAARHGDRQGQYVLALYTSCHSPLAYGRDFFDEPKKDAEILFQVDRDRAVGSVTRHGTRIVEIAATLGADQGGGTATSHSFNYRFDAPWNDLEAGQVTLRVANFAVERTRVRDADGILILSGSPDDPIQELPCRELRRLTYFEGRMDASVEDIADVPVVDYLPFLFGRYDEWR